MYFFSLYFANILYIHFDSSSMRDFIPGNQESQTIDSPIFIKGKNFFDNFIAQHPFTDSDKISDSHLNLAYKLIHSFLSQLEKTHLTVYIQFSKNMFGESYIHSQLYKLFGKESIVVVDNIKNADIVISDFYEQRYKDENYFHFDDVENKDSWNKLFSFVHKHQLSSFY